MLGEHPELYGLPEVNLFGADTIRGLLRLFQTRRRLEHGLLRAIAELGLGGQTEENITAAIRWLREYPEVRTADVFRDLGTWAGERALVDKSPLHVYMEGAMDRMLDAFPNARFIHLTRHPRHTCESVVKLQQAIVQGGGRILSKKLDPDQVWLRPHRRIDAFLGRLPNDQYQVVRGEDLLADPDVQLGEICQRLGISVDAAAIENMKHPERSPYAALGPPKAPFGTDPGFMKSPALRKYEPKPVSLEGPVAMPGNPLFSEALIQYAQSLGYM
jgi:hypothetical protein